ncbi:hypothetical protein AYO20_06572 [Fonsecaea nubica]|uniref:Uncharacterized protein n=1 Tax=Fonsecaea nubica TaxID=856822 RepID=A0A178CXI4_9EURO|nr:hypothetical protein AYO20_06572 [Fonsecaea nubica]OAL34117.1 hypothetical protein AYO20_06572 [Fonsecaea nubica]
MSWVFGEGSEAGSLATALPAVTSNTAQATKTQHETIEGDRPPQKRTEVAQTDLGRSLSEDNEAEQITLQHPEAKSLKPPFASFLKGFVDPVHLNPDLAHEHSLMWKHDELKYYTQKVDSFLLQNPDQYLKFRKYGLNIIDWGKDTRLKVIQTSLDNLLEEGRKRIELLSWQTLVDRRLMVRRPAVERSSNYCRIQQIQQPRSTIDKSGAPNHRLAEEGQQERCK